MATEYRIDVLTPAGIKIAEVTDYLALTYHRKLWEPGLLSFQLRGDHSVITQLANNSQVIVYRRNVAMGLGWTADFWGLFRGQTRHYSDHEIFTALCPGILTMLSWRIVGWTSGAVSRSQFDSIAAETVLKTLVNYNAGAAATTANGRVRNGTISGITVQTDQARGNLVGEACAWQNLLTPLQRVAKIGGGDFDLVWTGGQTWDFRYYPGQLGTDRTATIMFALERDNIADVTYSYDRTKEITVAIVGGAGKAADRTIVVRTSADYVSGSNDLEMFVDDRQDTLTSSLNAFGDAKLYDIRARQLLGFKVLQVPSSFYGVHYQFGDLVKSTYAGAVLTQKIISVGVTVHKDGSEQIDVGMQTQ